MTRAMRVSSAAYQVIILVGLIMICSLCIVNSTMSYTSDGVWEKAPEGSQACKQFMCTPSGMIWKQNSPSVIYNNVTACDALIKKGIKKIVYYGDSYLRHIYAAMLITLNGNYATGSMKNPESAPHCRYHVLFQEKHCNYWNLNHYGVVCGGQVILDPILAGIHDSVSKLEDGTVALWSFGNHPLAKPRHGVNDAPSYQGVFEKEGTCPYFRDNSERITGQIAPNGPYSVWWVSTHQRVVGHFPDEKADVVRKYNHDMREWVDEGKCGRTNYIDVFNMTDSMVVNHSEEARKLSFDMVHWGFEINLIKAQIILNALLSQ